MAFLLCQSSTSLFIIAACLPTACLTPEASYIIIAENTAVTANISDEKPYLTPIIVDRHVTNELWELGIPPDIIILDISNFFSPENIFKNWAAKHDNTLTQNISFEKKSTKNPILSPHYPI